MFSHERSAPNEEARNNAGFFRSLPNEVCSGRILSGFVIDLDRARKRLRPEVLEVPPVTNALALADEFQRLLDTGAVKRRADLARRFNLSRARVTQLLDLHKLHPEILDFVRALSSVGPRYLSVRQLRLLCPLPHEQQLSELREECSEFDIRSDQYVNARSGLAT